MQPDQTDRPARCHVCGNVGRNRTCHPASDPVSRANLPKEGTVSEPIIPATMHGVSYPVQFRVTVFADAPDMWSADVDMTGEGSGYTASGPTVEAAAGALGLVLAARVEPTDEHDGPHAPHAYPSLDPAPAPADGARLREALPDDLSVFRPTWETRALAAVIALGHHNCASNHGRQCDCGLLDAYQQVRYAIHRAGKEAAKTLAATDPAPPALDAVIAAIPLWVGADAGATMRESEAARMRSYRDRVIAAIKEANCD